MIVHLVLHDIDNLNDCNLHFEMHLHIVVHFHLQSQIFCVVSLNVTIAFNRLLLVLAPLKIFALICNQWGLSLASALIHHKKVFTFGINHLHLHYIGPIHICYNNC
jgi:hypothetical protein